MGATDAGSVVNSPPRPHDDDVSGGAKRDGDDYNPDVDDVASEDEGTEDEAAASGDEGPSHRVDGTVVVSRGQRGNYYFLCCALFVPLSEKSSFTAHVD